MIAAILSFVVVFFSFNFFMLSYQVNGINRLVTSMPLSLFETAIEMLDIDETNGPHFDKAELENNLTSFFDYHLPRYTNSYTVDYYYYNAVDHSIDMDDEYQAVEVKVNADLILFKRYQKSMYYEIRRN